MTGKAGERVELGAVNVKVGAVPVYVAAQAIGVDGVTVAIKLR